jgi:hypothetical protein
VRWIAVVLAGICLADCSSYYVDLARFREQQTFTSDEPMPRRRVVHQRATRTAPTTTGAVDDDHLGRDLRARGRAEHPEETERIDRLMGSICRGC